MWAKCYSTPVPLSSPVHSDWSSEDDQGRTKERERLSKIIREQQRKTAEEERKKKEEDNAMLHELCAPDLINAKPNSPLIDALVQALGEKEKNKRKIKIL